MSFERINVEQARHLIANEQAQIVDIRDENAYRADHITNAHLLSPQNIDQYIAQADLESPLIIYCYHGHSSQTAAAHFKQVGFDRVYSLDGGFEAWRNFNHP